MLKQGMYKAENHERFLDSYVITMEVTETDKSFIFVLVDFDSRYGAQHIEALFRKSKRVVIRKNKGGHAMRIWGDEDFTLYPFQAGIPFYFKHI